MKIWLKLLVALVIGIIISFFLPADSEAVKNTFKYLSNISLNLLLYFSVVFISVKTYLGVVNLKRQKISVWKDFLIFLGAAMFFLVFSVIISIFIMNISIFQPSSDFKVEQSFAQKFEIFNFSDIFKQVIASNVTDVFVGQIKFLLPAVFLAVIFGYGTVSAGKKGDYFFESVSSFNEIMDKIAVQFVEIFPIGGIFMIASLFRYDINFAKLTVNFIKPFSAILIVVVLLMIILSVLLRFILKESIWKYYLGLLGAALTGFFTGNTASTVIPLNYHLKRNVGVGKDLADFVSPLGSVVNQTGSGIVAAVIIMTLLIGYSQNSLSLGLQMLLFLLIIISSLRLDGANEMGFLILIAMILKEPTLKFEETSYLIFLAVAPLLSRIAVFINVFTTGMYIMITARLSNNITKKEYIDFI